MKLPKQLGHSKKDLIDIHVINNNECFKCCLVRYLHPADHNPARIRKVDKDFAKERNFNEIKFPVKIRDMKKFQKRITSTFVFLLSKQGKTSKFSWTLNDIRTIKIILVPI